MRFALLAAAALAAAPLFAHPPVSVVVDSRGNVYYSDLSRVWRVTPSGAKSVAVPNVHTHELYLDRDDNLFGEHLWYEGERTDRWGHYVWKRDARGRVSTVVPRREGFLTGYSFVRDAAGAMYWPSADRKSLVKSGTTIARGFRDIRWMTAAPDGTVYLIDDGDVARVARDGRVTRLARGISHSSMLRPHARGRHSLQGVWLDGRGNVYVADAAQGVVKRVSASGEVRVVAESTLPWSPAGGAFAPNGDLLLLEFSVTNEIRLRRVRLR